MCLFKLFPVIRFTLGLRWQWTLVFWGIPVLQMLCLELQCLPYLWRLWWLPPLYALSLLAAINTKRECIMPKHRMNNLGRKWSTWNHRWPWYMSRWKVRGGRQPCMHTHIICTELQYFIDMNEASYMHSYMFIILVYNIMECACVCICLNIDAAPRWVAAFELTHLTKSKANCNNPQINTTLIIIGAWQRQLQVLY